MARLPHHSLQGRAPSLLTSCAIVDLGVRASPQELHRNPPKLGDHCNGSQQTMNAGRSPPPPHTTEHQAPPPRPLTSAVHLRQEGQMLLMLLGQVQQHLCYVMDFAPQRKPRPPHFRDPRPSAKELRRVSIPSFRFRTAVGLVSNTPVVHTAGGGSEDSSVRKYLANI